MWTDGGIYLWFAGTSAAGAILAAVIHRLIEPAEGRSVEGIVIAVLGAAIGSFAGLVAASLLGLEGWASGLVAVAVATLFAATFVHRLKNWTPNNID